MAKHAIDAPVRPATAESNREQSSAVLNIGLVEDDATTREALAFLLRSANATSIAAFGSAEEFLSKAKQLDQLDCVLLDASLPGMNGLQLQEALSRSAPFVSVVFVSGHDSLPLAVTAMKQGAVDFLQKPVEGAVLITAVKRATDLTAERRRHYNERAELVERLQRLTTREKEAFQLIVSGMLNKQVAAELGISEKTVKIHRARAMAKMGAGSLAELVRIAGVLELRPKHD